jgi:hypothetical protein
LERKVNAEVGKIAPWKIGSFEIMSESGFPGF